MIVSAQGGIVFDKWSGKASLRRWHFELRVNDNKKSWQSRGNVQRSRSRYKPAMSQTRKRANIGNHQPNEVVNMSKDPVRAIDETQHLFLVKWKIIKRFSGGNMIVDETQAEFMRCPQQVFRLMRWLQEDSSSFPCLKQHFRWFMRSYLGIDCVTYLFCNTNEVRSRFKRIMHQLDNYIASCIYDFISNHMCDF